MSEHKAVGEQIFIGGVGTGDYLCACGQFFPCDTFKAHEAIRADREKLAGLVEAEERYAYEDFPPYDPSSGGEYLTRTHVLEIIRTTPIGDEKE